MVYRTLPFRRRFAHSRACAATLAALVACASGACLPSDTRAPPAVVELALASRDPTNSKLVTSDGWSVELERILLSVGEAELEGDDCSAYSESDYLRVLDLQQPTPQKLATLFARGNCTLAFRMQGPGPKAVLGANVTGQDLMALRIPGSDPFVPTRGTAFYVAGSASNGSKILRFSWSFRRDLQYQDCGPLSLGEGRTETLEIVFDLARLFRMDGEDTGGRLLFEPYAALDGNTDGLVTLEELAVERATGEPSLAEWLYLTAVPDLLRVESERACAVEKLDD